MTADDIRDAVAGLRAQTDSPFRSARYLEAIDPRWLDTPDGRGRVWAWLAALVAADPDYGCHR